MGRINYYHCKEHKIITWITLHYIAYQQYPSESRKLILSRLSSYFYFAGYLHWSYFPTLHPCVWFAHSSTCNQNPESHSWVIKTQELLFKYQHPCIIQIAASQVSKEKWKDRVKSAVCLYWRKTIDEEASEKSTLRYLNPVHKKSPHLILRDTQHNSRDVRRAHVKARLLCGAYILQTNRAIFNQTRDVTCPLCNQAEESITHFLIECEKLEPVRRAPLQCLKDIIPLVYQDHPETNWSSELLTQLVLDPTHPLITNILPFNQRMLIQIERQSHILCYKLHLSRCDQSKI